MDRQTEISKEKLTDRQSNGQKQSNVVKQTHVQKDQWDRGIANTDRTEIFSRQKEQTDFTYK